MKSVRCRIEGGLTNQDMDWMTGPASCWLPTDIDRFAMSHTNINTGQIDSRGIFVLSVDSSRGLKDYDDSIRNLVGRRHREKLRKT